MARLVGAAGRVVACDIQQEMLDFIDSGEWSHDYELLVKAIQIASARKIE